MWVDWMGWKCVMSIVIIPFSLGIFLLLFTRLHTLHIVSWSKRIAKNKYNTICDSIDLNSLETSQDFEFLARKLGNLIGELRIIQIEDLR